MRTKTELDDLEFSLVLGGPVFQLMRKGGLTGNALEHLRRRTLVFAAFTWLPLWLLASAAGSTSNLTFLQDLEVHFRFLVALPLLILAEILVHRRMRALVPNFLQRKLIPENYLTHFHAAIGSALRLRNSLAAELWLVGIVYLVGVTIIWPKYVALDAASWYSLPSGHGPQLTWPGLWYVYVSLPIFQFILVRWYFRMLIWTQFLFRVSRIPLQLIPTHPDGVGGIGFLCNTVQAFVPLLMAHGALLAGWVANRIFFLSATLLSFKLEILLVVAFLLCLVLGPLLLFSPQLHQAKLTGLAEYGNLAHCYVSEFDHKWLRGGAPTGEPLIGSADIQSLADLANSYQIIKSMRPVPISRDSVLQLVGATLVPFIPLGLTMMPLEEILNRLVGVIL